MSRTINAAVNFAAGFLVAYLVASRVGDGDGALKPALLSGVVTAAVAWVGYERYGGVGDDADGADAAAV